MPDDRKEWSPSMPLRADATEEQIFSRELWLKARVVGTPKPQQWLRVVREFASACVEASQSAPLGSGMASHHRPLIEAVVHQLEHGEASVGDLDDIRWCALSLRSILNELPLKSPSPPSAGQEHV